MVKRTWNTVKWRKIEGSESKECKFEANNIKIIKLTILKAFYWKKIDLFWVDPKDKTLSRNFKDIDFDSNEEFF